MSLVAWCVYPVSLAFFAMGTAALLFPEKVTVQFGIAALPTAAKNEIRAVYGGFGIMIGVMLLVAVHHATLRNGICLTVAAALAGMALGRIVSFGMDKTIARAPLIYGLLELILAGLLMLAVSN